MKKSATLIILVILTILLAILLILLIGWQTGFAIKSDSNSGLKVIGDNTASTMSQVTQDSATQQDSAANDLIIRSHRSRSSSSSSDDSSDNEDNENQTYDYGIVASIQPSSMNIAEGNEFSVKIEINSPRELYAAEFSLDFDSSLINLLNITEGNFLRSDSSQIYSVTKINNTAGKVTFATTRLVAQNGVSGEGSLATLKFKALTKGAGKIYLSNLQLADTTLKQGIIAQKSDFSFVIG